jgi:hypothetical protein
LHLLTLRVFFILVPLDGGTYSTLYYSWYIRMNGSAVLSDLPCPARGAGLHWPALVLVVVLTRLHQATKPPKKKSKKSERRKRTKGDATNAQTWTRSQ